MPDDFDPCPIPFPPEDPAKVVQRQLDAFNAFDLEALLNTYAAGAQLFEHPWTLLAEGRDALRKRFRARLNEPDLHASLLGRMVMGNFVIDHEEVRRNFPEGPGVIRLMMIYEVSHGEIVRAWTIPGPKTLDP